MSLSQNLEAPSDPLDTLLRALADPIRRELLDRLRDAPGLTLNELIAGFSKTRQALSKHLVLLEQAELVVPLWRGREKRHFLNPAPLKALPARWITASAQEEANALDHLQQALAEPPPPLARSRRKKTGTAFALVDAAGAAPRARAAHAADKEDRIAAALMQAPAPLLRGQAILLRPALVAAIHYLEATGYAVQSLIETMDAKAGYERPPEGGFSLVEHLAHLADVETLGWRSRFERILQERNPRLPGVDGDRIAAQKRYQDHPWLGAARRFVAERKRSLALLARYDETTLHRPVVFAGQFTNAGHVLAAAVAHDLDHRPAMAKAWIAQLKQLRSTAP